jgi:hypothetical protein
MGALASAPAPLLANSERTTFKCASASQFPRAVFAKPIPGSVQTRQGSIPASFAARALAQLAPDDARHVVFLVRRHRARLHGARVAAHVHAHVREGSRRRRHRA